MDYGCSADTGGTRVGCLRQAHTALRSLEHDRVDRLANTNFIRSFDEVVAIKQQPGKDIYLVGGAMTTASLIDAGLVDELRMIVYPLIACEGKPLFAATRRQRGLDLKGVQQLSEGRISLVYSVR